MTEPLKESAAATKIESKEESLLTEQGKQLALVQQYLFTPVENKEIENKITALFESRDFNEVELAYYLYHIKEFDVHLDKGFRSFRDYILKGLKLDYQRVNSLVNAWTDFDALGLPLNVLSVINWSKFKLLHKAIKLGVINSESIYMWLPLIALEGDKVMLNKDIIDKINQTIAEHKGLVARSAPEEIRETHVKFKFNDLNLQEIRNHLDIIKTTEEVDNDSKAVLHALRMTSLLAREGKDTKKLTGLRSLVAVAKDLAPELAVVFIPTVADVDNDNLDIVPTTKAFVGYSSNELVGVVIAQSQDEARDTFMMMDIDVDVISHIPLVANNKLNSNLDMSEENYDNYSDRRETERFPRHSTYGDVGKAFTDSQYASSTAVLTKSATDEEDEEEDFDVVEKEDDEEEEEEELVDEDEDEDEDEELDEDEDFEDDEDLEDEEEASSDLDLSSLSNQQLFTVLKETGTIYTESGLSKVKLNKEYALAQKVSDTDDDDERKRNIAVHMIDFIISGLRQNGIEVNLASILR